MTERDWNKIVKDAIEMLNKAFKIAFGEGIVFESEELLPQEQYRIFTNKEPVELLIDTSDGFKYYPQGVKYDPGVYRYSDGSGEPPSQEEFDLLKDGTVSLKTAVLEMMGHCNDLRWQGALQCFEELLMAEEEQEYYKMLESETILGTD